ncbi:MAG: glycosyltransferase family 4 protein [Anaerolineae bacterium]|nr:glycosyltransferase family 4 protein [Anaerolineae bacterium]
MRILMLLDDAADLQGPTALADEDGFLHASARRDIAVLVPRYDPSRVQVEIAALRGDLPYTLHTPRRFDPAAVRRLLRLARQLDIELIHATGHESALYSAIAGLVADIPAIATFYDMLLPADLNPVQRVGYRIGSTLLRRGIDHLIFPSELTKRLFLRLYLPHEQMEVIHPGIDMPDEISADRAALGLPEGPLVTMIAPLTEDQGYDVFLKAIPRVVERVPEVQAAIVGTGLLADKFRAQATDLPITWLGERSDIAAIITASDVIVVHPRREGIPFVLMQAAAAGKPTVAARTISVTEIIAPSITGMVVTPGDARDLAIQLARFIQQPGFAQQLATAAQRRAREKFSLAAQRDTMTTLYESTIYATR